MEIACVEEGRGRRSLEVAGEERLGRGVRDGDAAVGESGAIERKTTQAKSSGVQIGQRTELEG